LGRVLQGLFEDGPNGVARAARGGADAIGEDADMPLALMQRERAEGLECDDGRKDGGEGISTARKKNGDTLNSD
jgi:hypothetical protein